ncbi:MAG: hypothetical protein ABI113_20575 [Mucilaginibacter sp.]
MDTTGLSTVKHCRGLKEALVLNIQAGVLVFEKTTGLTVRKIKLNRDNGELKLIVKTEME